MQREFEAFSQLTVLDRSDPHFRRAILLFHKVECGWTGSFQDSDALQEAKVKSFDFLSVNKKDLFFCTYLIRYWNAWSFEVLRCIVSVAFRRFPSTLTFKRSPQVYSKPTDVVTCASRWNPECVHNHFSVRVNCKILLSSR